ncbi:MAG: CRISPR-associated endonuclease Cas1 [Burkholderiales bacterium]
MPPDAREPLLRTLYVDTQGSFLARQGERLVVKRDGHPTRELLGRRTGLVMFRGHGAISTAALGYCLAQGIGVAMLDGHGRPLSALGGGQARPALLRAQFRASDDAGRRTAFARAVVRGKIENSRLVLRRHARERHLACADLEQPLSRLIAQLRNASVEVARGLEGQAARLHFRRIGDWLGNDWGFNGRNRQPARDPFNAMLSYGYAVLGENVRVLAAAAGLDPRIGLFHAERPGHAALASDLMEEFRPLLVDAVCLQIASQGRVTPGQFEIDKAGSCRMNTSARHTLIHALEAKLSARVKRDDDDLDWRRVIGVQARRLATWL